VNNRSDIQHLLDRVIDAYNGRDASAVPLADDVVYRGPMVPEPLHGAAAVRQHISEIAPFVARTELKRLITEGECAAAIIEYQVLNGVTFEGGQFFRFRDGLICEVQVFFDPRTLIRGGG